MKHRDPKFFNLKDMILAAIIIGLLIFTFIPVEEAEKEGGPAFGTQEKAEPANDSEQLSDLEVLEQPIPAE